MYRASSEARNATAAVTSSTSTRPTSNRFATSETGLGSGAGSSPPPNSASTAGLSTMRVATPDGFTQFTRIPCGASQVAKVRISPTTPCLLAT